MELSCYFCKVVSFIALSVYGLPEPVIFVRPSALLSFPFMVFTDLSLFVGPSASLPCPFMGFTDPSLFVGSSALLPRPCYRLSDLVTFCETVGFIASSLL